jgi:thymidine kinase
MFGNKAGYLRLYIGCMYSGKSTALLNEITRYKVITSDILVINHRWDQHRHNQENAFNFIRTHDGKEYPAVMLNSLCSIFDVDRIEQLKELYSLAKVVIIDEAQFFPDLFSFLHQQLKEPKTFIVGGLSGDYNMEPIGHITRLVPLADEIIKLEAYCVYCREAPTRASFSKRLVATNGQILVGKEDMYAPVCRYHHSHN